MINCNQIEKILKLQAKFKEAIEEDRVTVLSCEQEIGKEIYKFIFSFKDPDMTELPIWKCL